MGLNISRLDSKGVVTEEEEVVQKVAIMEANRLCNEVNPGELLSASPVVEACSMSLVTGKSVGDLDRYLYGQIKPLLLMQ